MTAAFRALAVAMALALGLLVQPVQPVQLAQASSSTGPFRFGHVSVRKGGAGRG